MPIKESIEKLTNEAAERGSLFYRRMHLLTSISLFQNLKMTLKISKILNSFKETGNRTAFEWPDFFFLLRYIKCITNMLNMWNSICTFHD